ncbi:GIY-YIG nuclease family protein [Synechococcus elongatus]|uniref:GIY-YIG nuclease family protein n=1 Tax=Synechococcus elongatus TaxID=32046 RepID=UPI000F7EF725|nr:GIY-YIG nuclease family protein [Synechococcus elongatus]
MTPALNELPLQPFVDAEGQLPLAELEGIGIYAIYDRDRQLQLIHYSRNVSLSLQQHLLRQPDRCYWFRAQRCDRPDRQQLETLQQAWLAEQLQVPPGNGDQAADWEPRLDVRQWLPESELTAILTASDFEQPQLLKAAARRWETELLAQLTARGVRQSLRFDPKQKELGRLTLKSDRPTVSVITP